MLTGLVGSLVPGGLFVLAVQLALVLPASGEAISAFVAAYPLLIPTAGVVLALCLRRGRALVVLLALTVASEVLRRWVVAAGGDDALARFALDAVAVMLPLNFTWMAVARERGILTASGLTRVAIVAAEGAAFAFAWAAWLPALIALPSRHLVAGELVPGSALPQLSQVAFALAAVVTVVQALRVRAPLEAGMLWALILAFLALGTGDAGVRSVVQLQAAAAVVGVAVLHALATTAYRDALTGLPGRRALDEALVRLGGRYVVAMADIDHFKKVNDTHGHDVGDQVLRMVAARLATASGGTAYRYGGEEFAIIFPGASLETAQPRLETLRAAVEAAKFTLREPDRPAERPSTPRPARPGRRTLPVTVSIGAAEPGGDRRTPAAVREAADAALYRAKRSGRNRVCT